MGGPGATPRQAVVAVAAAAAVAIVGLPGTRALKGSGGCKAQLPCNNCHAATKDGLCAKTQPDALCTAVCDDGWYATSSWTLDGTKDAYQCIWKQGVFRWDNKQNGHGLGCEKIACDAAPTPPAPIAPGICIV